jgi:hypothetical protein
VLSSRWRNLRASFIAFVPYAVLVAALVIALVRTYSLGRYTLNSVKERGSHGALRSHPKTLNCIQHTASRPAVAGKYFRTWLMRPG